MPLTICFVSDYFCPNTGGVESHMYYLAGCLMALGHRVVVVTHTYGGRSGIRLLSNGLKVYYLPFVVCHEQNIWPSLFVTLPAAFGIIKQERVDIVHAHSSVSTMAQEFMFHAKVIGVRTVFTDHSLFGFSDLASIAGNRMLQCSLVHCDRVICVSHTCKENTVLRARLPSSYVYVIPNALNSQHFLPALDEGQRQPSASGQSVTVIVAGRMVYRKGVDLLAAVIPAVCDRFDFVNFLIAGDGPRRIVLEETRERYGLQRRVRLVGNVPHDRMADVLRKGQILLSTSLTEAFCTTLLEGASCGLHVVATNVGGVPEVLPDHLITLTEPNVKAIVQSLCDVIERCRSRRLPNAWAVHRIIDRAYSWRDVALRTERVYADLLNRPTYGVATVMQRHLRGGCLFAIVMCAVVSVELVLLQLIGICYAIVSLTTRLFRR